MVHFQEAKTSALDQSTIFRSIVIITMYEKKNIGKSFGKMLKKLYSLASGLHSASYFLEHS